MCGGFSLGDTLGSIGENISGGFEDVAKFGKQQEFGQSGDLAPFSSGSQSALQELAPGLSILALPLGAAGGAALAGGEASAAGAAGGAAAGGESGGAAAGMFGPGAADTLDSSLIGPEAGAAAGSGSQFAPAAIVPSGDGGGGDGGDGTAMLSAATPTETLSPAVAESLGVNPGFSGNVGDFTGGTSLTPAGSTFGDGLVDTAPVDIPSPPGGEGGGGPLDGVSSLLKSIGLSPASAGLLGVSAIQALSKPKIPQASKTLQENAGPNASAASATIQSGGTSSPAWTTQKASIDATIDEQIKQQTAAMLQQAQNSGQGTDSQVTLQQINKLKTQLETQRQQLYAQAQAQNVQAALQSLGISDQALSSVAKAQFDASSQAKQSAAQTAQTALILQALQNRSGGGSSASVVNEGSKVSA